MQQSWYFHMAQRMHLDLFCRIERPAQKNILLYNYYFLRLLYDWSLLIFPQAFLSLFFINVFNVSVIILKFQHCRNGSFLASSVLHSQ
jgi:hypothetical protein